MGTAMGYVLGGFLSEVIYIILGFVVLFPIIIGCFIFFDIKE